jgi:acetoin utilization deacetylase AcuC-like enzyme
VLPALRVYRPELLLVSSGFDAGALDPLSHIMLSSEAFAKMTRAMMAVAAQCCSHRLVMVHEGGYSAASVPFLAARTVDTLCGTPLGIVDPFREEVQSYPGQEVQLHQELLVRSVLERARQLNVIKI